MTDVLIRDIPDDVVSAIEAKARRLGLSRTEYLRRQVVRVATTADEPVTVESLRQFARTFGDLADPEITRGLGVTDWLIDESALVGPGHAVDEVAWAAVSVTVVLDRAGSTTT